MSAVLSRSGVSIPNLFPKCSQQVALLSLYGQFCDNVWVKGPILPVDFVNGTVYNPRVGSTFPNRRFYLPVTGKDGTGV
jgi:hypothetical protein